jgi:hypothetical protein
MMIQVRSLGILRPGREGVGEEMKKALSLILVAGLALAGVPVGAQGFGPNSIWGVAPASASWSVKALLVDATGTTLATVPVVDGKFAFHEVGAGQYTVLLQDAAGQELARSQPVTIASGNVSEALFGADRVAPAAVAGGIGTTGWILIGAAAVGITTAIVIAADSDDDTNVASPTR